MRFQRFLLDNYIASEEGQKVYLFFKNIRKTLSTGDKEKEIINFINSLLNQPIAEQFFIFESFEYIEQELSYPPFSVFEEDFSIFIKSTMKKWNIDYRDMLSEMPSISLKYLYECAPAYAFPYLYPVHFNIFQEIFHEFDIYLPALPSARQYKERCYYYLELCRSLYDFRQKHELSPVELCTFLYGFAPKFLKKYTQKELPQASKVWLVGADKRDSETLLANINDTSIIWWAGREEMNIGDIVFIYEVAPLSKIRYMTCAMTNGFDDPFQYFSGKVWLAHPIEINFTYEEMKSNKHFSQHSIIKSRMKNLSGGRKLSNQDYDEIKKILKKRKFDIALLPETISYTLNLDIELNNEHDIEVHLLEPLLEKLAVQKEQITRQMPLRMGRGVRYYPDYVINATPTRGSEQASFIWEAKYRISSKKDLQEAFYQAKSYALRLSSNGLGLASYEGIWIALAKDKYQEDKILHYSWAELEQKDTFQSVFELLRAKFAKLT